MGWSSISGGGGGGGDNSGIDGTLGTAGTYADLKDAYDNGWRTMLVASGATINQSFTIADGVNVKLIVPDGVDIAITSTIKVTMGDDARLIVDLAGSMTCSAAAPTDDIFESTAATAPGVVIINGDDGLIDGSAMTANFTLFKDVAIHVTNCRLTMRNSTVSFWRGFSGTAPDGREFARFEDCTVIGAGASAGQRFFYGENNAAIVVKNMRLRGTFAGVGDPVVYPTAGSCQVSGVVNESTSQPTLGENRVHGQITSGLFSEQDGWYGVNTGLNPGVLMGVGAATGVDFSIGNYNDDCAFIGGAGVNLDFTESTSDRNVHQGFVDVGLAGNMLGSDHLLSGIVLNSTTNPTFRITRGRYDQLNVRGTSTLSVADDQYFSNCYFAGSVTISSGSERNVFMGCHFAGTVTISGDDCVFIGCYFASTLTNNTTTARFFGCNPANVNVQVQNHTADDTLTTIESGKVHTNLGAIATVTLTLPSAPSAGMEFTFHRVAAQAFRVDPATNDAIIYGGGGLMSDGEYLELGSIGAHIKLISNSDGNWMSVSEGGTLNEETP